MWDKCDEGKQPEPYNLMMWLSRFIDRQSRLSVCAAHLFLLQIREYRRLVEIQYATSQELSFRSMYVSDGTMVAASL